MENATEYGDARECLQAARVSMRQVKRLLSRPSPDTATCAAAQVYLSSGLSGRTIAAS